MKAKALLAIVLCILGSALIMGQTTPQPRPPKDTPNIPGVVAAGTKVQQVWTGTQSADGIVSAPDGGLLYAEEPANRISKLDKDNKVSTFMENTNGTVSSPSTRRAASSAVKGTTYRLASSNRNARSWRTTTKAIL